MALVQWKQVCDPVVRDHWKTLTSVSPEPWWLSSFSLGLNMCLSKLSQNTNPQSVRHLSKWYFWSIHLSTPAVHHLTKSTDTSDHQSRSVFSEHETSVFFVVASFFTVIYYWTVCLTPQVCVLGFVCFDPNKIDLKGDRENTESKKIKWKGMESQCFERREGHETKENLFAFHN